jgi:hypothetical protein
MQDVLKVVSFDGFFGVEKLQKLLNKLRCDVHFQRSDFDGFIDNKLQEEFINSLEMWPCWVDFILCLNTCLRELQVGFLNTWEGSENIFLNHGHNIV